MTLKEKFEDTLLLMPLVPEPNKGEINNYHLCISKVAEIADDYAIEFAEWCIESEGKYYNKYKYRNRTELLEIFKKEQK